MKISGRRVTNDHLIKNRAARAILASRRYCRATIMTYLTRKSWVPFCKPWVGNWSGFKCSFIILMSDSSLKSMRDRHNLRLHIGDEPILTIGVCTYSKNHWYFASFSRAKSIPLSNKCPMKEKVGSKIQWSHTETAYRGIVPCRMTSSQVKTSADFIWSGYIQLLPIFSKMITTGGPTFY